MSADDRRKLLLKGRHPMTGEFAGPPKPCRLIDWWHTECGSFGADTEFRTEDCGESEDSASCIGPNFVADIDWPVNGGLGGGLSEGW